MRKTHFFLTALACLPLSVFSQYYRQNTVLKDSVVLAHGISELKMTVTNVHKGKSKTILHTIQYDQSAAQVFEARFNDTLHLSRIRSAVGNQFKDKQPHVTYNIWHNYSQLKYVTYNEQNRADWTYYFNHKGKNFTSYHYLYKDSLMQRMEYFKKHQKLQSYYLYSYAPNKKMQHSALYNSKGKLIRYWDYNCDDEGTVSRTKSDTLKVCTQKKYLADGTVISTTNTFDFRGEPVKYVEYHNAQQQLIRYMVYSGKNDVLTYQVKNSFIGSKLATQHIQNFSIKGKPYSAFYYSYNVQGSLLSQKDSFFNGSKIKTNTYAFTYNDKGLLSSKSGYDSDGKLFTLVNYRYRYFKKD